MNRYFVIYNPSSGKELAAYKVFGAAETLMNVEDAEFLFYATKKRRWRRSCQKSVSIRL